MTLVQFQQKIMKRVESTESKSGEIAYKLARLPVASKHSELTVCITMFEILT
jgi:hypothetical protein